MVDHFSYSQRYFLPIRRKMVVMSWLPKRLHLFTFWMHGCAETVLLSGERDTGCAQKNIFCKISRASLRTTFFLFYFFSLHPSDLTFTVQRRESRRKETTDDAEKECPSQGPMGNNLQPKHYSFLASVPVISPGLCFGRPFALPSCFPNENHPVKAKILEPTPFISKKKRCPVLILSHITAAYFIIKLPRKLMV